MERMYASDGRHPTASGAYMAYTWQDIMLYGRGPGAGCLPALTHSCSRRIAPAGERALQPLVLRRMNRPRAQGRRLSVVMVMVMLIWF